MQNKDYWSKLKLNECWSEKQRYNILMNYIIEKLNSNTTGGEDEQDSQLATISVTVKDKTGGPVANADVSIYDKGEPFEGTTGSAGGCTIKNVPYGAYTIEAVAEGYDFTVDTRVVDKKELSVELVLEEEG